MSMLLALALLGAQAVPGPPPVAGIEQLRSADRAAIDAAMQASAAGWNSGDIDRFLAVYDSGPDTLFVGGSGVQRGVPAIRARYLKSYPTQFAGGADARRSRLSFETAALRPLGPDHALMVARYTLTPADGGTPRSGPTSLVFHRTPAGWRIIADHSS